MNPAYDTNDDVDQRTDRGGRGGSTELFEAGTLTPTSLLSAYQ